MEGKARPPRVFSASGGGGGGENTNYKGARECLQQRPTRAHAAVGEARRRGWACTLKGVGKAGGGGRAGVILADGCVSSDLRKDSSLLTSRGAVGAPVHRFGSAKEREKKNKASKKIEVGEAATSSRRRQRRHCE